MVETDFSKPRPAGEVSFRWLGSKRRTFKRRRVASALAEAAQRWFASNHSPDAFVVLLVIERDGKTMSDAEAIDYIEREVSTKRAVGLRD